MDLGNMAANGSCTACMELLVYMMENGVMSEGAWSRDLLPRGRRWWRPACWAWSQGKWWCPCLSSGSHHPRRHRGSHGRELPGLWPGPDLAYKVDTRLKMYCMLLITFVTLKCSWYWKNRPHPHTQKFK